MKQFFSILLAASLVCASFLTAFAAEDISVPPDVKGLPCEAAVSALIKEGVISGYPDGTFQPANTITRAEACIVAVKSMKVSDSDITAAQASGFPDLDGYDWAVKYINYGVKQGLVKGYPDGSFRPAAPVTKNEMSAILIHSLGYPASSVKGTWPSNYYDKAIELGLYQSLDAPKTAADANHPAARADVAVMTVNAMNAAAHNGSQTPGNPQGMPSQPGTPNQQEAPENPAQPEGSEKPVQPDAKPNADTDSGSADTFVPEDNTNYYGMIADVSQVLSEGQKTQGITFLFGNKTGQLTCENSGVVDGVKPSDYFNGQLYQIKVRNHKVQSISAVQADGSPAHEITDGFTPVTAVGDTSIQFHHNYHPFADRVVVYTAVFDKDGDLTGYRAGSTGSITVGSQVRAYHVTKGNDAISVVVLVKAGDVSKL